MSLVQRHRSLAISEHVTGVTRGCQCAEGMGGGRDRQTAIDDSTQGLTRIEDGYGVEPAERLTAAGGMTSFMLSNAPR
ncbi:hypothetical protein [Novosphingobium sp. HII-3]|uniref:hypothetical protein n=1 Tax=Novosphingobium sp. HII-3 TaxID=2075565 RepID=UPI0013049652|nr:hypothetical protein [Novosphingobium sp. HII-3]